MQVIVEYLFFLEVADDALESRALENGLLKWSWPIESSECGYLMHNGTTTRRFSNNSDLLWVTAEEVDVLLDPFQSKSLVIKASICNTIGLKSRTRDPAEGSQSIIERHKHNSLGISCLARLDQAGGVVCALLSKCVTATIGPDQYRCTTRSGSICTVTRIGEDLLWDHNIQEKAIFGRSRILRWKRHLSRRGTTC